MEAPLEFEGNSNSSGYFAAALSSTETAGSHSSTGVRLNSQAFAGEHILEMMDANPAQGDRGDAG